MQIHGWQGVRRVKKVRTTVPDPAAGRAPDLVKRQFRARAPNRLLVADFTYVRLVTGVLRLHRVRHRRLRRPIVGWECSTSKQTAFVESAIRQAAARRAREGHPLSEVIHHSDAGSQYTVGAVRQRHCCLNGHDALDRFGRRRLRQRPSRDHDRALQARMHPGRLSVPPRPAATGSATSR